MLNVVKNYPVFLNIRRFDYKSSVQFSLENLSKIDNSYISPVENKKKFGQMCKKRNFVV